MGTFALTPALSTTTSSLRGLTFSAHALTDSKEHRSKATASARPPISSTARFVRSALRPQTRTRAPLAANRLHVARPTPAGRARDQDRFISQVGVPLHRFDGFDYLNVSRRGWAKAAATEHITTGVCAASRR